MKNRLMTIVLKHLPVLAFLTLTLATLTNSPLMAQRARLEERLGVVELPAKQDKVIQAKQAYEDAKLQVKESYKALTQARIELQKILKGRSGTSAQDFSNTTLREAETELSKSKIELDLLRRTLLAELDDTELKLLQSNIKAAEKSLQEEQSTSNTKNRIALSQNLSKAKSELEKFENTLLKKNDAYTKLAQDIDIQRKMIINLKKELILEQKEIVTSQMSPEIKAQNDAVSTAVQTHADALKDQKEAKKAWEDALAEATRDYNEYQQRKKELETLIQTRTYGRRGGGIRTSGRTGRRGR